MKRNFTVLLTILICSVTACQSGQKKDRNMDQETKLKIETTAGDIIVKLYNEAPQHRDNFIKLAEEGTYEGTLFHRVIKDFMIQAGDPESKNAPKGKMLGAGDVGYTIPAEFVYPKYFHKKGALSAARQGDNVNPKKESSGCQFYIVTGKVYNDTTLLGMENQMNQNRLTTVFNALAQKHMKEIYKMRKENDQDGLMNFHSFLDLLKLCHHIFIYMKTTGGIDNDHVAQVVDGLLDGALGNVDRVRAVTAEDRHADLATKRGQLVGSGGTIDVARGEQRRTALLLEQVGQLYGRRGLTGALQAHEHDDIGNAVAKDELALG